MYCMLALTGKEQAAGKMVWGNFFNVFSKAISNGSPVLEISGDDFNT